MKKSHKLIVALIFLIIILLIIFLSKDFIIRKYFISKLENVDYDEYILELSINGKPSAIYYYTPEYIMERHYDDNEKLKNYIITKLYFQNIEYYYLFKTNESIAIPTDTHFSKPIHLNNTNLLNFLNNDFNNQTFKYKGITNIDNIECYILEFKNMDSIINTIYLSKNLLYTVKIDTYQKNHSTNQTENKHIIYDYTLDLTLNKKYLFEI